MAVAGSLLLAVLAASAAALVANPPPYPDGTEFTIRRFPVDADGDYVPPVRANPADLRVTEHVIKLKRESSMSTSSMYVQAMRQQAWSRTERDFRLGSANVPLTSVEAGQVFLAPVTIGTQTLYVVIDTGSSDPWVVNTQFICADPVSREELDESECYFGPPYAKSSPTYSLIPNENFNITYADGEQLNGDMAYEKFTMGGITVPQQKFAVVDYAAWYGDGSSSGLVGFAYGSLTNAYPGNDPTQDKKGGTQIYNPLFENMYNQSLVAPVFSMAIDRDVNVGGILALGGIPAIPHTPGFVSAPIRQVGVFAGTTTPAYQFYEVPSDGWAIAATIATQFNPYSNVTNAAKKNLVAPGQVIVDSGTSLIYAPNIVADTVASLFRPPAAFDNDAGAYYVDCNAIPPVLGVSIAKKIFYVNGQDLIVPASGGRCIMGIQPNYGGLTILGDVWMKAVLCVFDIGSAQMRFSARQFYGLRDTPKARTT